MGRWKENTDVCLLCCIADGHIHPSTRMKLHSLWCKAVTEPTMCGGSCTLSIDATMLMQVDPHSKNLLSSCWTNLLHILSPKCKLPATHYIHQTATGADSRLCELKLAAALAVPITAACISSSRCTRGGGLKYMHVHAVDHAQSGMTACLAHGLGRHVARSSAVFSWAASVSALTFNVCQLLWLGSGANMVTWPACCTCTTYSPIFQGCCRAIQQRP